MKQLLFYCLNDNDGLQLVATCNLSDTLLVSLSGLVGDTLGDALRALPAEGIKALRKVGVREVVAGVHPVGIHGAEVLDLELEERAGELLRVSELLGEGVGLELELAGDDVHAELDKEVSRREGIREEDEADDDGVLLEEAKGRVQGVVVDEDREESEDVEQMALRASVNFEHNDNNDRWLGVVRTWEMPKRLVV